MSKKKYINAAEKQKAWRLRHGQKRKVPIELRRGEPLGSSETTFRAIKEGESWENYGKYVHASVEAARKRQGVAGGKERIDLKSGGEIKGGQVFPVDYYEMRIEFEKPPEGKKMSKRTK